MISRSIPDVILGASVRSVEDSGLLEGLTRMATVSAVNGDGTVDVDRGSSHFPGVRCLSGYPSPAVGDTVEILRTAGGWVCVGALITYDTTWQYPALNAGFANHGGDFQDARYRRTPVGLDIQGMVDPSVSGTQAVFYLPTAWCPAKAHMFYVRTSNGAIELRVYGNGEVRAYLPSSGVPAWITLDCHIGF